MREFIRQVFTYHAFPGIFIERVRIFPLSAICRVWFLREKLDGAGTKITPGVPPFALQAVLAALARSNSLPANLSNEFEFSHYPRYAEFGFCVKN